MSQEITPLQILLSMGVKFTHKVTNSTPECKKDSL